MKSQTKGTQGRRDALQEAGALEGPLTTLLAAVADNDDKLVVGVLSVLRDLLCRISETRQWIRTSALTLNALEQCVAALSLPIMTHANRAECMELGVLGGNGHAVGVAVVVA